MNTFGVLGIIERLDSLDGDLLSLAQDGQRFEITVVGGSALILLGLTVDSRITTDIDVMESARQAEQLLERYDMNTHVTNFRFRLPDNWRSRRQRLPFEGIVLDVFAPSNEDLAILKLDAWRDIDRNDLHDMVLSGQLDMKLLQAIVNDVSELRVNFNDEDEWAIFVAHLNELDTFAKNHEDKTEKAV
jgi:hypothetical protein